MLNTANHVHLEFFIKMQWEKEENDSGYRQLKCFYWNKPGFWGRKNRLNFGNEGSLSLNLATGTIYLKDYPNAVGKWVSPDIFKFTAPIYISLENNTLTVIPDDDVRSIRVMGSVTVTDPKPYKMLEKDGIVWNSVPSSLEYLSTLENDPATPLFLHVNWNYRKDEQKLVLNYFYWACDGSWFKQQKVKAQFCETEELFINLNDGGIYLGNQIVGKWNQHRNYRKTNGESGFTFFESANFSTDIGQKTVTLDPHLSP